MAASGVAFATPGSGILDAQMKARGGFVEQVDLKLKVKGAHGQEVIDVKGAGETVVQQIVLAPGGQTGWHTHHGPAVVVLQSGTLHYVEGEGDCASQAYTAGQAFVDPGQGHVHMARNAGTTPVELWVTYFDVPAGQSPRIDAADPGCA